MPGDIDSELIVLVSDIVEEDSVDWELVAFISDTVEDDPVVVSELDVVLLSGGKYETDSVIFGDIDSKLAVVVSDTGGMVEDDCVDSELVVISDAMGDDTVVVSWLDVVLLSGGKYETDSVILGDIDSELFVLVSDGSDVVENDIVDWELVASDVEDGTVGWVIGIFDSAVENIVDGDTVDVIIVEIFVCTLVNDVTSDDGVDETDGPLVNKEDVVLSDDILSVCDVLDWLVLLLISFSDEFDSVVTVDPLQLVTR